MLLTDHEIQRRAQQYLVANDIVNLKALVTLIDTSEYETHTQDNLARIILVYDNLDIAKACFRESFLSEWC